MKHERLVRGRGDADLGTGPAGDRFVKPDLLNEGRVLHQAQQRGPGWHQRSTRLLLGEPVKAPVELPAVLVEEHLKLGPGWLAEDVFGRHRWEGRHELSISAWPCTSQLPYRHDRRPRRGMVRTSVPMVSGRLWRAWFAGGNDDGDLAAEAEPGGQAEVVTAPETAGVIPVRTVAAGQQPHGLVGRRQHLRAVGGLQAGARRLVPGDRRAAEQQP